MVWVWVKLVGDYGGKSFKLCLQVCNLERRNAKQNTIVISCMLAKDLQKKLAKLTGIYTDQIQKLLNNTGSEREYAYFCLGTMHFCQRFMACQV